MKTPHIVVDGTKVEVVDGASLNTWRESGDWVALHNITSRGSTQKRRESGDWVALITSHRGSTHTSVATPEFLRKYKAVPKEVQGSI